MHGTIAGARPDALAFRMPALPTLRRELISAFAVVFAGALVVALAGLAFVVPRLPPAQAGIYLGALLLADVGIFSAIGAVLLRRRLLAPIDRMIAGVEAISAGELTARLPAAETREMARLSAAVTNMVERLIRDQRTLAENIRSLDETNRLLTEARDAMVRTEKMASVGRLSAGIAHEVGNPLGAILGYLGLIGRDHHQDRRAELLVAAEREARRIDRIIRGLLDFARIRDAVTQPVDVNAVVRETVELVQMQGHFANVTLALHLTEGPLIVDGDHYQLQQVLVNLLVNAADAIPEGEPARIEVHTRERAAIAPAQPGPARRRGDPPGVDYTHRRRLAASMLHLGDDPESPSGRVAEIVIADEGSGIPEELLPQIFEPFVTTKEPGKGTGLGLAVCARLVEGMGGAIRADNRVPSGAEFTVVLPLTQAEAGAE